jgi:hypothetical protein
MEEIPNQEQNDAPQPADVPDAAPQEVELANQENADAASEKSAVSAAGSQKSKNSEKSENSKNSEKSKNSKSEDGAAIPKHKNSKKNKKDGFKRRRSLTSQ